MKLLTQILICCFILIVFISIYNYTQEISVYNTHLDNINNINNFINGYWQADNTFSSLSGLDDMILILNMEDMTGVLIIIMDENIMNNTEFNIKISNYCKENKELYKFNMEFNKSKETDYKDFVWDNKEFNCLMSINKGTLDIYEDNTMMAKLIKNNAISSILE